MTIEISRMEVHTKPRPPRTSSPYGEFHFTWHDALAYDSLSRRHIRIATHTADAVEFKLLLPAGCEVVGEAPAHEEPEYHIAAPGELSRSGIVYRYQLPVPEENEIASEGHDLWVEYVDSSAESVAQFLLLLLGVLIAIGAQFVADYVRARWLDHA